MESTPQMNGHAEGREGDKEISDIVGADNTLPPYSASTRGNSHVGFYPTHYENMPIQIY